VLIIGIDPGNVTGIAVYDLETKIKPITWETPADQVGTWMRSFDSLMRHQAPVHVIGEQYVMTPGIKTSQPAALETMGVMKDQCAHLGWSLSWVQVRTSKKTANNDLLRRLGWYTKTKDGHANDGCRLVVSGLLHYDRQEYARLTGI
jgi:hypothetical protein